MASAFVSFPIKLANAARRLSGTSFLVSKNNVTRFLFDSADGDQLKYRDKVNSVNRIVANLDQAQTLSNKTLTSPVINGVPSGLQVQTLFCTTQFSATNGDTGATLTNIVGLTGVTLEAGATYKYEYHLSGTANAGGGIKTAFKYTTATLTSLEVCAETETAAGAAVIAQTTTTADQTVHIGTTAAVVQIWCTGRIVVNAAGTLALQAAQNVANAGATQVFVGSWMTLTRIS